MYKYKTNLDAFNDKKSLEKNVFAKNNTIFIILLLYNNVKLKYNSAKYNSAK